MPGLRPAAGFNRIAYANQFKKKTLRALAKQAILNFSYFKFHGDFLLVKSHIPSSFYLPASRCAIFSEGLNVISQKV